MTAQIYLFTGPEFGLRNEAVEKTKADFKAKFGSVDEYLFYASETPCPEFMAVLQNESLFSDGTCVVVKNADVIKKKDDVETVLNWIKSVQAENSMLILVSDEISIDSKIEKAVPANHKKIFWEMFENQKIPWLQNYFNQNGYSISEEVAGQILDMIENNTQSLKAECSRFFVCFPKGTEITEEIASQILTHTREENAFTLFNALADNSCQPGERFQKGLEILQKVLLSEKNVTVKLIAGLTSCFRKLAVYHRLLSAGQTDDFNLKINGISGKKQISQFSKASKMWSSGQTAGILALLSSTDMEIRSSGKLLEQNYLEKMIYEIVIKKGGSSASYDFDIN